MSKYDDLADKLYTPQPPTAQPTAPPIPAPVAQQAEQPANRYDVLADALFDTRMRTSVFAASASNPDTAARARKIAERTGMAPDAVERNLPVAERQVLVEDIDNGTQKSPALRNAYGDPYFAKAAKDDLFSLTEIEKGIRRLMDPKADDRKRTREQIGEVGSFLAEGAKQLGMGATVGLGAGIQDTAGFGLDLLGGVFNSAQLRDAATVYRGYATRARESMEYFSKKQEGNLAKGFMSGMQSTGTNLAMLPLGIAAGSEALVGTMATMVGAQSFSKARNKGQGVLDSAIYAAPDAVYEYAFEKVPASRLLADIAKHSTLATMVKNQLLPEIVGEQATTILQDLNEWVRLNPAKTVRQFIEERPDAAVQTLVATLVGVGVQSGSVRGVQRVLQGAAEREARARDAEVHTNNLTELVQVAMGSKLRQRDPQTFAGFAQAAAEAAGNPLAQVHVDATILADVLGAAKIDMATFSQMSPAAAEALPDAIQMGGDVAIPIGDLLGKMGDTGIETALLPHLRASPDALSQEEAKAEQQAAQTLLQQNAQAIVQQAADSQAMEQSVESVRNTVFAQLQATGRFSADVNRAYASMVGAFYTVLAGDKGITPEQAYAEHALRVQGVGQQGVEDLEQNAMGRALQERINADFDAAAAEYSALDESNGGQIINTDIARELSPEYRADRTLSAAVHEPASAFAKRLYAHKLSQPTPEGKSPTVLFTGGGTGAGKSTGLRLLSASSDAEIVYDTNMNTVESSVTKIEQALNAGRNVSIMYVYRDPVEALAAGALPRAMRMGRTVPIGSHAETHVGARTTIEKLMERYAKDPRVAFSIIDNSRGAGKAAVTTIDKLPQVVENGLEEKLYETVQKEYEAGRISEAVARGTTGESPAKGGTRGAGFRQQPEQAGIGETATLDDFTPERLPDLLSKRDWAILTAADPGAVKQSDEENAASNALLRADLDALGVTYTEAVGKYGEIAPSYIVVGIPDRVSQALGNKYGQESVLTRQGLVYQDGSVTPATGIDVYETAPEDFYTEVPGTGAFFSVQLDFDTRLQPNETYAQSDRAEGDTRYRDRAIELLADLKAPARSAVALMSGTTKVPLLPTNFDIARHFTTKETLDISKPQGMKAMVDALYADTIKALTDAGSAVGWYDRKVTAALNLMAEIHPEILSDEQAKFGFITMLAITSNSTKVNENFEKAEALYRTWKESGVWPTEVPDAKSADAMRLGLQTMQKLVAENGWQKVRDFMVADQTRSDIEAFSGASINSELANSKVYGAVFLGSKIGAFFNNLYGNFTPVTMDRWFMRTVNRVRGSMLALPESFPEMITRLEDQLRAGAEPDAALLLQEIADFKAANVQGVEKTLRALPNVLAHVKAKFNVYARGITDNAGKKHSYSPRTPENVLAKALYEALTLDEQTPNGGGDRALLRTAMLRVQSKLADAGIPIEMADLQAVLWYYEKDLFATLKGENRQGGLFAGEATEEAEDYETAARRLVRQLREPGAGAAGLGRPDQRPTAKRTKSAPPVDPTADLFGQAAVGSTADSVEDTATQVEQRRMRQAVDLALLQHKPGDGETLRQDAAGVTKPGEVQLTGVHFSTRPGLNFLNGQYYGTGLKGAEKERVRNSADRRLSSRTYFYVDEGKGVRPEAGVGGNAHQAQLSNLYDINADPLKLIVGGDTNGTETNILNAGFDGYYVRDAFNQQGAAVVIGDASRAIPVVPIANPTTAAPPLPAAPAVYKRGLLSSELNKINIDAIKTVAPSARISAGTFQVLESEREAAAAVAATQGISLPVSYAQDKGTRGTYNPKSLTITLLENADLSTFLHETGHFMLETMAAVAGQADAPVRVREDMQTLLQWFGVKSLDDWSKLTLDGKRPHHEKFAESFEQYLFEGKAPSKELQPLFQRFTAWFERIYQTMQQFLRSHNTQLNDEVRAVFDRMLATKEQIAQKQEEMAYTSMFTMRPDGMTDEEFADWMMANQMATGTAEDELRSRSLRDLRWVLNARSRELVKLRKGVAEKRKAVEAEVRAEVAQQPVYAVQRWIKTGMMPDGTQTTGALLNTEDLRAIFGDGPAAPWRYLATNMISASRENSLHPDVIAEMFGFQSGDQMVREIVGSFPEEQTVQGMTDNRVLERHGDIASQRAMDDAANAAVHNEYRAKVLASELKAMTQATQPVRLLTSAAKSFAEQLIGRRRLKDVKPFEHERAEERAAKKGAAATAKGDLAAATAAKRDQVLQFHAAKAAREALDEVRRAKELFEKIVRGKSDDTVGKTRDMDLVNATRAILANYGFGGKAKSAHDYLMVLNEHDPVMFDTVYNRVIAAEQAGKPFNELTVDELRALVDEVKSFWLLAKRSKQVEIDGKLVDLTEAQDALTARIDDLGIPLRAPGEGQAVTPAEKRLNKLQTFIAAATRVESWITAKDGGPTGVFRKYIYNTIKDAADSYRADRATYARRYTELLATVGDTLTRGTIAAPEIGYTFGKGEGGIGMSELLHALLHTGNESNKRKLLLGRKWATENTDGTLDTTKWDDFIQRMQDEGKLTKKHYDFAQGVWDMLESTKGQAQKMHRDVFGRYFNEVTADGFVTQFGIYRGGYVPAMADPGIVSDAKTRALAEEENQSLAFAFPTTNKGFTKSRVEYNRPLMLDLRTLSSHLDKVLMFSHLEGPVRDVRRVLTGKGVAYALNRQDPVAFDSILTPWLNRTAKQIVETPVVGDAGLMRFFSAARNNAGMAAMFANVANAAQQITGFSIAATQVPPRLLMSAMASYIAAPRETAQAVADTSVYMAGRMDNEVSAMHSEMNDILLDPNVYEKAKAWSKRHSYFLQAAVDNVVGPVVWVAARNHALEQGMTDLDARRHADSVIRTTQGSTLPEDVSRIETGNAFVRTFTQFMGYFNMQANLLGSGMVNITRDLGLRKGAGKALYLLAFGALAPAWVAEAITQAFKGGPGDDDKDGWYLDDWIKAVFGYGTIRTATAMVPVVGQVLNAVVNAANSKPYDDRIGSSPAIGMIEATVRAPITVYKAIADEGNRQKAVRDVATAISMITGIPVSAAARPLGYLAGVQAADINPTGALDAVRGALTGTASPKSKE